MVKTKRIDGFLVTYCPKGHKVMVADYFPNFYHELKCYTCKRAYILTSRMKTKVKRGKVTRVPIATIFKRQKGRYAAKLLN